MLDYLNSLDQHLMLTLNYDGTAFTDTFWFNYSSIAAWIISALAILGVLINRSRQNWREMLLVIVSIILIATLSDQISASLIKPWAARLRPSHCPAIQDMLHYVNGYHGGRYGFVSSHAANSFGMAGYLCLLFRRRLLCATLILWAIGNCYSRIYLGVHYPGDLIGGTILGLLIALFAYKIYETLHSRILEPRYQVSSIDALYRRSEPWPIIAAIGGTIIVLLVLAII